MPFCLRPSHYWVGVLRVYQFAADVHTCVGSLADDRTTHSPQLVSRGRQSQSSQRMCGSFNKRDKRLVTTPSQKLIGCYAQQQELINEEQRWSDRGGGSDATRSKPKQQAKHAISILTPMTPSRWYNSNTPSMSYMDILPDHEGTDLDNPDIRCNNPPQGNLL